jgi:hypothetical protein
MSDIEDNKTDENKDIEDNKTDENKDIEDNKTDENKISRKDFLKMLGLGAAALSLGGLASVNDFTNKQAGAHKPNGPPSKEASTIPTGSILKLPSELSAKLLQTILLPNPKFEFFYKLFTEQKIKFIPEQAQFFLYIRPPDPSGNIVISPVLLAIVPGFQKIKMKAPSHEAASIVAAIAAHRVYSVFASKALVGHDPFKILSLSTIERRSEGGIVEQIVKREELKEHSAKKIAEQLGPLESLSSDEPLLPTLSDEDTQNLARIVYRDLIKDSIEGPSFSAEAIKSMASDTRLVVKFSLVQSQRAGMLGFSLCTCTSTSCLCTSTSGGGGPTTPTEPPAPTTPTLPPIPR